MFMNDDDLDVDDLVAEVSQVMELGLQMACRKELSAESCKSECIMMCQIYAGYSSP